MQRIRTGTWPDYRRDSQLTGNSSIPAFRSDLKLRSSYPIGGSYQEVKMVPDGTGDLLLADGGGIQRVTPNWEIVWKSTPFGAHSITGIYDVDDDQELEIVTSNGREALLLSAETGEILWRENVALPNSYGTYATMLQVCRLLPEKRGMQIIVPCFSRKEVLVFDASDGARNTKLLHALWMDDSYHPTTCIGDVNRDGIEEIVIARLGGVYVFDPVSGRMLTETLWSSDTERRRNYGHFELCDIDNDGDLEAVILSDRVSRHIAVLDNNGQGKFTPLWDRFIQHIYPLDTTELRYTKNSLSDVDGDGYPEICVSIFNGNGDTAWHTEVLRSSTGETLLDLPNKYLRGVQDIDLDGCFELLMSEEFERVPKRLSKLSIQNVAGTVLWEMPNARFAERTIGNSLKKSQFKPEVFSNDEVWFEEFQSSRQFFFFTVASDGSQTLSAANPFEAFLETPFHWIESCESRVEALTPFSAILSSANGKIRTLDGDSVVFHSGYHLTTESHIAARPGPVPTVVRQDNRDHILVPTFSDEILCLVSEENVVRELWRLKGRSRIGYDNVYHEVSVLKLENEYFAVIIDDGDSGFARLSLYDLRGKCRRSYQFENLPSHSVGSRIGAYDWLPIEHSTGHALFVSFYQSPSMNSECSLAIHLESGKTLWTLDHIGEGEYGRGVGAWGAASMHLVNGKPEAVLCAKDTILRIDLETGLLTHPPKLLTDYTSQEMNRLGRLREQKLSTSSSIEDPFTAYGSVILKDIDNDGVDELLCVSSFGGFGIVNDDMSLRWWRVASFGDTLYRMPAVCDIDDDGTLEMIQGHSTAVVRVYDTSSGEVKQTLDIGAITTDIISCEFDRDGERSCITGSSDGRLLLLGFANGDFGIRKEWSVGSAMGSPIVAEIEGHSAILFASGAGELQIFS